MNEFKYKDFADFLSQKGYKKLEELSTDEQVKYQAEYLKEMREFEKELREKAIKDNSEEIQKAIKESEERVNAVIAKQIEALLAVTKTQGEALGKLMDGNTSIGVVLSPFEKSIEDNMENIKSGASHPHSEKRTFSVDISGKAAFTAGSVVNNTDALRLQEIGQLASRRLSIWDSLPKIPVPRDANGTVRYTDWSEGSIARAAAMIAEGGTFPESTAVFQEYSITLKKVGDTIPITEESLYDRARFAAELNLFLQTNVNLITDQQVFLGDGTGNNMSGFYTTATTYVPAASGIADPSIYDLIVKVREVMTAGKDSKIMPNVVYMNIVDINRYKLKKDANNNYVMPPFVDSNGSVIDGITVIESNIVASNTLCMADNRFIRVYEEQGLQVSTGLVNDQFTRDLITLKARRRAEVLVRQADRQAVYRVTDISAALVTLGT